MKYSLRYLTVLVLLTCAGGLGLRAHADTIAAGFSSSYQLDQIGAPAGVPGPFGGIAFLNSNTLLIGGAANNSNGAIYSVGVTRDVAGHVNGFSGPASLFATAPNIDGGLVFGPGGVLFYTAYPSNQMGQIKSGSSAPDKIVSLSGKVASSVGSLQFAPNGDLKILSYNGGGFYTCSTSADGSGTYNVDSCTLNAQVNRGPEGIVYIAPGSPLFSGNYALMAEYSTGSVGAYQVDANYNVIVGSRQDFITGLSGAEGAAIDPLTNDFLFSTFGGSNHIDVVSGFSAPSAVPEPGSIALLGTGLAGVVGAIRRKLKA